MDGRVLTNLLLAVIAGVLLFGRDAMVSGVQGIGLVVGAVVVIWIVFAMVGWLASEVIDAYRECKDWKEAALTTAGFAALALAFSLMAYVGWLWLNGVEQPYKTALEDSWLGTIWTGVVVIAASAGLCMLAFLALRWLYRNWKDLPGYFLVALGAPVMFPLHEWRIQRANGTGLMGRVFAAAYMTVAGLAMWLMIFGGGLAALSGLGAID